VLCALLSEKARRPAKDDPEDLKDAIPFSALSKECAARAGVESGVGYALRILKHPEYQNNVCVQFIAMKFFCLMNEHMKLETQKAKLEEAREFCTDNVKRLLLDAKKAGPNSDVAKNLSRYPLDKALEVLLPEAQCKEPCELFLPLFLGVVSAWFLMLCFGSEAGMIIVRRILEHMSLNPF